MTRLVVRRLRCCHSERMGGKRPPAAMLCLAAASAVPVLYAGWARPRMLTWGATRAEVADTYPGDEIIPVPDSQATMATTLAAPPKRVWPWLAQMGGDRGGWYSWDWLDNDGKPSADRVVPDWQSLAEGQQLHRAAVPGRQGASFFTVAALEPNRSLVLHSTYDMFTGESFDPQADPFPWAYVDGVWGLHLRATPGGETRLVVRTRSRSGPGAVARPFGLLIGEPLHYLLQTAQFRNLRNRVAPPAPRTSPTAQQPGRCEDVTSQETP